MEENTILKNQLRSGVIISYINLAISSLIPFIYTPIMLRMLGQSEYGLYSLANSAVSYLSLLSFGFGSTIIRYIAKYRAENNKEAVEKMYGFFILLYCFLALVVLIVGTILSYNVEPIFHRGLTANEQAKMKILVRIMTVNSALSFPVSVFSSMITAYEKYIYRKLIDMLATIGAPIANLIALYLGYASVGMSVAATVIQVTMLPLYAGYCFKILKLKPRFSILPRKMINELFRFSAFVFLGSVVDMLFWSTDKVLLGMLSSSVAVAIYNVGGTFNNIVMQLSTSISGVLTPKITGMVVKNASKKELTELFVRVGRLQFLIIGIIVSGFTVFGRAFINLWAGPDYAGAYWVTILTLFPLCIPLIQNTGLSILIAQNKHQFRSIIYLFIAILNVISTYLAIPSMGYIGAALCSCIAYLIGQGLIMNIYYYKVTGLDIPLFWKNIIKLSIIPGCMMVCGLFAMRFLKITNWILFFVGIVLYSCVYAGLMYRFSLNDYEKDIFRKPLLKFINIYK